MKATQTDVCFRIATLGIAVLIAGLAARAQVSAGPGSVTGSNAGSVPHLVKFSGTVRDDQGRLQSGIVGITFSLYKDQDGGAPLWLETQNVQADANGHYTVMLGVTSSEGLPMDFFTSNEARWVGVQPQGQSEQPRILLVSTPYALKAADADTLGGKPASAFLTIESQTRSVTDSASNRNPVVTSSPAPNTGGKQSSGPSTPCSVTTDGNGTSNSLTKFLTPCEIVKSSISESGGSVTLGGSGILNLPQTTGSGAGVIKIGGSRFLHACCSSAAQNTFIGTNAGNFTTTGVGVNTAIGFNALSAITSGARNTAAGNSALSSSTIAFSNTAIGYFALSRDTVGDSNTGIGDSTLTFNTSGFNNTALGFGAMQFNSTGHDNTATGLNALGLNTTGGFNTAIGQIALGTNTVGSYNTGLGYDANVNSCCLTNATAIGAGALAAGNDMIVLGCTSNCFSGTIPPNVGIGTASPFAKLDIMVPNTGIQSLVYFGDTVGGSGDVARITYDASASPFPLTLDLTSNSGYQRPFSIMGGKVGIGTNAPDNLLTVNGSADKPGGGSWGTFSDGRLKTVEATYNAGLDAVLKLTPVRYRYKEQNSMGIKDDQEHVGFVAQDVEKVIPEAVSRNSQGYLLVNNDPILWTMLNAIKQQQAEIEALTLSVHDKDLQIQLLSQQAQALQEVQRRVAALKGPSDND